MSEKTWEDWHERFQDDMREYERAATDDDRAMWLMTATSALANLEVAITNLIPETT